MQPKETLKVKHALPRDGDAGTHVVIRLLTVWHNDVQSIGGASLKENDQALCARSSSFRSINSACEKAGNHAGANDGQRAIFQENSASNRHKIAPKSSSHRNTDNPDQGTLPTLPKSPELPKLKTDPCFSQRLGVSVVKIAFFRHRL
jgi:hypothetical protein